MTMTSLEEKIDALTEQVSVMAARQSQRDELMDEMLPILKEVMAVATAKLGGLEEKGYFTFGRELVHVIDNVVTGYSAADVELLAESVVGILDAVRQMTQPQVMEMAAEAGQVVENAENIEPVGMLGMVKASRDEDVQRGMAMMLEVLRRAGAGAAKMSRRQKLQKTLGSRRSKPALTPARRRPTPRAEAPAPTPAVEVSPPPAVVEAPSVQVDGVEFTSEGFLANSDQWTRAIAEKVAATLGVTAMTDLHWKLIEAARADFAETGASPNIRRLTKISGVGTKDIYQMFPKAPGKCTAKVAGLPKPVGCI